MSPTAPAKLVFIMLGVFLAITIFAKPLTAKNVLSNCDAPAPVCAWIQNTVGIKTPSMVASGTMIAPHLILTNRHVVEDHDLIIVRTTSGDIMRARPVPHDVPVDLVILQLEDAEETNVIPEALTLDMATGTKQNLHVVAFDQGRNQTRAYAPSSYAVFPNLGVNPRARIHSDAKALPGNSGGAVVDKAGKLVGILAAGDGNISEIIPISHLPALLKSSSNEAGTNHAEAFFAQGKAIRDCADLLYDARLIVREPSADLLQTLEVACLTAKNKMLFDQAGQKYGQWWMFAKSEMFLLKSLNLDPNSPNTLMSLAVTYHLNREMEKEKPILARYLDINPQDSQALRLAVQVAGFLKDKAFAELALGLMAIHNPAAVPMAKSYIDSAFAAE
ncbi:serine protease [Alphaproteobacteria bacterium]|nr:serine protease [Alphaproteobacteria bacterium]